MQCSRSNGCVYTALLHELLSQKEHLQRYHQTALALSRLLMQSLIGHRPCGSTRLRMRPISPTARRCIPVWEDGVRGSPPPRPKTHSRRPLSGSIAQTRDMQAVGVDLRLLPFRGSSVSLRTLCQTQDDHGMMLAFKYLDNTSRRHWSQ